MGFMTNNAGTNNNQPAVGNNGQWEKAAGFLNLYLPTQEAGKRRKLGAIPLRAGNVNEKKLLEWLNEDPARVSVILSKLIMEYVSAEPSESSSFDLSAPVAPAAGNLP